MSEFADVTASEGAQVDASPSESVSVASTPDAGAVDAVPEVEASGSVPVERAGDTASSESPNVDASSDAAPSGKPAFLQLLNDTLGDDATELDDFVGGLKQKHIERFSPEAKQTIKNMLRAFNVESARVNKLADEREAQLKSEARIIDERARGLHAQRAALLKMLKNPNIEKNAQDPGISHDEMMTPEGQKKYLEHLAAKQWKESLEPLQATTQREARALAYQEWASDKPEMRDDSFKTEMRQLIEQRKSVNMSLSTADAYEIVRARRQAAKADQARARENAVRAASARQIGRGNGTAEKPKAPPKRGGARAIADFLKANPDYQYRGRNARR